MKTTFLSIDTKRLTCCAQEERWASGAAEGGIHCVIIPKRRAAAPDAPGKILDFDQCRRSLEQKQAHSPEEILTPPPSRRQRRREALCLAADLCASAAVVAAAVLVLLRFWIL